jgi:pSer/pThr/pTyr-binding forkhead associated (FHA) protein
LGTGETTVGRSDEADIYLGDVTVSRMHAKFVVDEEGLSVDDLGSTNGTYVNMERFDSRQLHPGDEIIIGKFHLGVVVGNG